MGSLNTSVQWDDLLSSKDYLADCTVMTRIRVFYIASLVMRHVGATVLNIGSGQGFLELIMGARVDRYYWVSMDISEKGLLRLAKLNRCSHAVYGNVVSIPIKDYSIGCVVIGELMEHIPRSLTASVFNELKRVGDSKTTYIFSVPLGERRSLLNHPVGHVRKYTEKIFLSELNNFGFKIVRIKRFYAFNRFNGLLSFFSEIFSFRRPNNIVVLCIKS